MARTGTELVLLNDGRVGGVATGIGGTLVLPPLNVDDVKHHFGEVKGFPGVSDLLVEMIKHGVPVVTSSTDTHRPILDKLCSMETTVSANTGA